MDHDALWDKRSQNKCIMDAQTDARKGGCASLEMESFVEEKKSLCCDGDAKLGGFGSGCQPPKP